MNCSIYPAILASLIRLQLAIEIVIELSFQVPTGALGPQGCLLNWGRGEGQGGGGLSSTFGG